MAGDSLVVGDSGDNQLTASFGDDVLIGNAGNDTLTGSAGNDILDGGDGDDLLSGGDGDDVYLASAGNDTITTGGGNDTLDFEFDEILGAVLTDADGDGQVDDLVFTFETFDDDFNFIEATVTVIDHLSAPLGQIRFFDFDFTPFDSDSSDSSDSSSAQTTLQVATSFDNSTGAVVHSGNFDLRGGTAYNFLYAASEESGAWPHSAAAAFALKGPGWRNNSQPAPASWTPGLLWNSPCF